MVNYIFFLISEEIDKSSILNQSKEKDGLDSPNKSVTLEKILSSCSPAMKKMLSTHASQISSAVGGEKEVVTKMTSLLHGNVSKTVSPVMTVSQGNKKFDALPYVKQSSFEGSSSLLLQHKKLNSTGNSFPFPSTDVKSHVNANHLKKPSSLNPTSTLSTTAESNRLSGVPSFGSPNSKVPQMHLNLTKSLSPNKLVVPSSRSPRSVSPSNLDSEDAAGGDAVSTKSGDDRGCVPVTGRPIPTIDSKDRRRTDSEAESPGSDGS